MKMNDKVAIKVELEQLVADVRLMSTDLAKVVDELIAEGQAQPLTVDEATALLSTVVKRLKQRAERDGDDRLSRALAGDIDAVVSRVVVARTRIAALRPRKSVLAKHNGIEPEPVEPTPRFHRRDVPMYRGYARTSDLDLWGEN